MKPYDSEIIQVFTHNFYQETNTALFTDNKHWKDPTVLELETQSPPIQSNTAQQLKGEQNKKGIKTHSATHRTDFSNALCVKESKIRFKSFILHDLIQ